MSDIVRELEIVIKRTDSEYQSLMRSMYKEEQAAIKETAREAKAAEKEKAAAIRDGARVARQIEKETTAAMKAEAKARAEDAKAAAAVVALMDKQVATEKKEAERSRTEAAKKSARDILASVKEQIEASKRLEREAFDEGRRLARAAADEDRRAERNAIKSSKLAFAEKKAMYADQKKSTNEAAEATDRLTKRLTAGVVAGKAWSVVRSTFDAIADSIRESTAHLQNLIKEGERARSLDREIAALGGRDATVLYSAEQAGLAAQAAVSPDDFRRGQVAFQAQAGQFIGDGPLAKLDDAGAASLMQKVASFSASQGIDVEDPARLMGAIIAKAPKGATQDQLMTQFGKVFKGLQLAPGETSPLIGQMTELIQQTVGPNGDFSDVTQVVPLIRSMAENNPAEAATYGRALTRGLMDIRGDEGKMKELGITKGMSFREQIGAVADSADAFVAGGGDEDQFLKRYFKDRVDFAAVRVALNSGVRDQGWGRVDAEMAGVDARSIDADIARYKSSEEGVTRAQESGIARARLEQAAKGVPLAKLQRTTQEAIEGSGVLGVPQDPRDMLMTNIRSWLGAGSYAEQLNTEQTGSDIAQRLSGSERGRRWMSERGLTPGTSMFSFGERNTPEAALQAGARELEAIRASANKLDAAADKLNQAAAAFRPPGGFPIPAVRGRIENPF